jgi:hypothetical protein
MKDKEGKAYNQAVLSFNEERRGITAWLAEPGPMGALQFISPDANLVAAFVVKEPAALVDDLINGLSTIEPDVKNHLKHFEDESGLNITRDFATPLGGEFAFAIDGPLLPKPSWKMVLEVYDPSHLQSTYERLIEQLNAALANEGKRGFEWEKNEAGGLTFYTLRSLDQGLELSYAYIDGYMVVAPSRALVDRAARYREAGYSLLHSPRFIASLPEDKNANFSAFVYQNLAPLIDPLAKKIGALAPTAEQQLALKSFADAVPVLAYAYAYDDRIIFSLNGEKGPLGLSPSSLLAMPGGFGLHNIFDKGLNRLPRGVDRDLRSFEQPPEKNR